MCHTTNITGLCAQQLTATVRRTGLHSGVGLIYLALSSAPPALLSLKHCFLLPWGQTTEVHHLRCSLLSCLRSCQSTHMLARCKFPVRSRQHGSLKEGLLKINEAQSSSHFHPQFHYLWGTLPFLLCPCLCSKWRRKR